MLSKDVHQDGRPDKRVYELTPQGRQSLQEWVEASTIGPRLKDEFFMKMVLSRLSGIADPSDPAAYLLVEGAILHLQADLKWLDLCEEKLTGHKT